MILVIVIRNAIDFGLSVWNYAVHPESGVGEEFCGCGSVIAGLYLDLLRFHLL